MSECEIFHATLVLILKAKGIETTRHFCIRRQVDLLPNLDPMMGSSKTNIGGKKRQSFPNRTEHKVYMERRTFFCLSLLPPGSDVLNSMAKEQAKAARFGVKSMRLSEREKERGFLLICFLSVLERK